MRSLFRVKDWLILAAVAISVWIAVMMQEKTDLLFARWFPHTVKIETMVLRDKMVQIETIVADEHIRNTKLSKQQLAELFVSKRSHEQ